MPLGTRSFGSTLTRCSPTPAERAGRVPDPGPDHLRFEPLLSSAKRSTNRCDFALVAMLGLLGLRIFEATGSDIEDLGEGHGHRVLRVRGKDDRV
jgi:integrase/recombinase XerD